MGDPDWAPATCQAVSQALLGTGNNSWGGGHKRVSERWVRFASKYSWERGELSLGGETEHGKKETLASKAHRKTEALSNDDKLRQLSPP